MTSEQRSKRIGRGRLYGSLPLMLTAACSGGERGIPGVPADNAAPATAGAAAPAMPGVAGPMVPTGASSMPMGGAAKNPGPGANAGIGATAGAGSKAGTGVSAGTGDNAGAGTNAGTGGGSTTNAQPGDDIPTDGIGPDGRIVEACQGFPLDGLQYSPGGNVLPNVCAPFDPWTNNPYAVQCIVAYPAYETPFPGDDYCILPPPPDRGVQFGVHPQASATYWQQMWAEDYSGYEDASVTAPFEVQPGGELLQTFASNAYTPITQDGYFYRYNFRGRYGSHHSVGTLTGAPVTTEGWDAAFNVLGVGTLASVQRANTDVPQSTLEIPSEEQGIGKPITANTGTSFQLHHFNSTNRSILREIWMNVWYVPESEVTTVTKESYINAPVNYPAGQVFDNAYSAIADQPTRVLSVFGHRHAWTTRFYAWIERADGTEGPLIYDSYDWYDMPTFAYNSSTQNPAPDENAKADGAFSGQIMLNPLDRIRFNCHVETTQERAAELGVAAPTQNLLWANEAFTGEMCVLTTVTTDVPLRPPGLFDAP